MHEILIIIGKGYAKLWVYRKIKKVPWPYEGVLIHLYQPKTHVMV